MKIRAGEREFELPEFQIGDRVLYAVPRHAWQQSKQKRARLLGTVVGVNLLVASGQRYRIWLDQDSALLNHRLDGTLNGPTAASGDLEPMPAIEQLAEVS